MVSVLIADDDESKILNIIDAIKECYKDKINIYQASTVQEAVEVLQCQNVHLLISDLQMPIRPGEEADENGGRTLVREIYKPKLNVNVPIYIVGLTQHENIKDKFSEVWRVWAYDSGQIGWKQKLKDLLVHIGKINSKIVKDRIETVFVEGITDQSILQLSVDCFNFESVGQFEIQAVKSGGGASWVERQLVIWGKSLHLKGDSKSEYLRAVGLFDHDEAGLAAIAKLRESIRDDTAENRTLAVVKLDRKHAKHLIPLYVKGISIPVTLEEMLPPNCWKYALSKGWLIKRDVCSKLFRSSEIASKSKEEQISFYKALGLSNEELLYVEWKFDPGYKTHMVDYLKGLQLDEKSSSLYAFKELLYLITKRLKIA